MERLEPRSKDIVVDKGKMTVRNFETADKEVVDYFQEVEAGKRPERLDAVIRTGVIALKTVRITDRLDYIEKEFMRMNNLFNESIDRTVDQLEEKMEAAFGKDGQFSEVVKAHFGEDGRIVKDLFNPVKEGTPLNILRNEIRGEINVLKTELGLQSQKDAIEKKTPLKGPKFEDMCEVVLGEIVSHSGDILERTTNTPGSLRPSKKGDFVITLKEGLKIVYEVKDLDTRITFPAISSSLNEAIQNRDAVFGVFLVKNVEALPQAVGWFNEYEGNKLVCALGNTEADGLHDEVLKISFKWAKIRALSEAAKSKSVDSAFVQAKIGETRMKLQGLSKVKNDCTSIEKSTGSIRKTVEDLQNEIDGTLSEILQSLTVA